MKFFVFFVFAAVALIAQPALANYPCPGGPGPGEQQIGVGGGSHGIAAVPLCVATGHGGARVLGLDQLLATEPAVDARGHYTGEIVGADRKGAVAALPRKASEVGRLGLQPF